MTNKSESAAVEAVAWAELTASGRIAYFDGRPILMVGPVGNEHHPVALYPQSALDALRGEVAENEGVIRVWRRRCEEAERRVIAVAELAVDLRREARLCDNDANRQRFDSFASMLEQALTKVTP